MKTLAPSKPKLVAVKTAPTDKNKVMTKTQVKPGVAIVSVKPPAVEHSKVLYPFTHPESNYDNPNYWESEESYFGLGADTTPPPAQDANPWYVTLASGAMNLYQQYLLSKQNDARAKAGMAPLSAQEYAQTQIPPARAQVGLDPQTRNMLMYGGLGLGAILLFAMLQGGGRKRR